jgi:hypothetical protein
MDYSDYFERQTGGQLSGVFMGSPRQRGYGLGGVFKSLFRYMVPLFKNHAIPAFKRGARTIGQEALRAATNVGIESLRGDNFKESVKNNLETAMSNLHDKAQSKLQSGSGRRRKNKKKSLPKRINKKTFVPKTHSRKIKKKQRTVEDIFS